MARPRQRKSDAARQANLVIRRRTTGVMVLLIGAFLVLLWRLYDLQINRHEEMQNRAVNQQTRSAVISASRGTIYDRNGNTLAVSATAETINISPKEIDEYVKSQEKSIEEAAAKAAEKKETYTAPELRDQTYIARGLSRILEVDQEKLEEAMENLGSQYFNVRKKVERELADQVRQFMNGEIDEEGNPVPEEQQKKLRGIWIQPDTKRYYTYSSLAANVLGFVNADNQGALGLEAKYNDVLEGTAGMTVTAKNGVGTELLYQYEQLFDAENGHSLVLTLDVEVQSYLEKGLQSMVERFDASNGATGIVMDVNTGALVAMASYPNYDLNEPGTIQDKKLQKKREKALTDLEKNRSKYETEEAYDAAVGKAKSEALNTQWRNKCIDSTYEPGSTYKPITLAMAIEEGLVSKNSTFNCTGAVKVGKWTIRCSKRAGHGQQNLEQAVGNSCNPAFINMGQRIGSEKYYEYMKAFGLAEKTGVDMVGEVSGILNESGLKSDPAALASYSFGQTFNVTPLELIRAQAACINGGYLYTPYVVEQELDDEGGVVYQHEAVPVRQVISEETSAVVRECLEYVVAKGGGKNGQVAGYRIGGKTGTADKTGTRNTTREVVVSFMCFAPADDPQYIMLLTMDTPSRSTGTPVFGGTMVAPVASSIMADILPALGVEPDYTADELSGADTAVPNVVGKSAADAKSRLEAAGFACRTVGSGDTVTDQTPAGGAIVPGNASIVLYLGAEKPDTPVKVPNVVGRTAAEANRMLTNAGLIMKVSGTTSTSSGNVKALSQNLKEGAEVPAGTVVTVQFGDSSVLD
nr:penicillin-binding transpeptidase domain-containing protein [uncultured Dysosmobacter sp.]